MASGVLPGARSITGLRCQCQNASHSRCPPGHNRTVFSPEHKLSCECGSMLEHPGWKPAGKWDSRPGNDTGFNICMYLNVFDRFDNTTLQQSISFCFPTKFETPNSQAIKKSNMFCAVLTLPVLGYSLSCSELQNLGVVCAFEQLRQNRPNSMQFP